MQQDEVRKKLSQTLLDQAASIRQTAKKGTIDEMFQKLYDYDCNNFVMQLTDSEKNKFLEVILRDDSLLQKLINWVNISNLRAFVSAAADKAPFFCERMPFEKFKAVLNELEATNVFSIFKTSSDEQRMDIIREIDEVKLTELFLFACQQPESELELFLGILHQMLKKNEIDGEDDGEIDFERISEERKKIIQVISELNLENQITILKNQQNGDWLDFVLEQMLTKVQAESIMQYLLKKEIVCIMSATKYWPHYHAFFDVLEKSAYSGWKEVSKEDQISFLKDCLEGKRSIGSVFDIKELAELYSEADVNEKEFILKDVLQALEKENEEIYRTFYVLLENEQDSGKFLQVMFEAENYNSIAQKMQQMLQSLESRTTLEKVYLNSFNQLCEMKPENAEKADEMTENPEKDGEAADAGASDTVESTQ